jgi:hypothetical protein
VEILSLLLEKRHEHLWRRVPGIAAGDEDGIDAGSFENIRPFLRRFPTVFARIIFIRAGYQIQTSSP